MDNFMARFAQKLGCTVHLRSGREFTSTGSAAGTGGSCATCGGCSNLYGDVGLADEGIKLVNSVAAGLELSWACPGCGRETVEATSPLSAIAQARECKSDPLCVSCRKST
jgi:hypothetical protein